MSKILTVIKSLGDKKNSLFFKLSIAFTMVVIITICIVATSYSEDINNGLSQNLIRLHVLANSDSPEDQALKQKVRNIVIENMKDLLKNSGNIEQTKIIVKNNLGHIKDLAEKVMKLNGKEYKTKVMMGNFPFPTKVYGDVTLPAGNYQALRIVIGKGEGANWWCVLFPPLCFVDATHGTVPESVKHDLKEVLTENEYKIITASHKGNDVPIKIKFKIVELFQQSKFMVTKRITQIFNINK